MLNRLLPLSGQVDYYKCSSDLEILVSNADSDRQSVALPVRRMLFALVFAALIACAQAEPWQASGVGRVVAISDVHGAYDGMLRTLHSAGVIDDKAYWAAGGTHLVITGDVLDRGADSRKVMDLIMALEQQALEAGGQVHLLLGNHEVMNLVGDLRYVSAAEYAAFSVEEDTEERARWFEQFRAANADVADPETLRVDFDKKAPPGFFAHRRAFRSNGYYGKWLLSKPLLLVIDGTAYVHGGLSPLIAELGLAGVNQRLRTELQKYTEAISTLNDAGVLSPIENFYYHAALLEPVLKDAKQPEAIRNAAATVVELNDSDIHSARGPLWYRGNVGCDPLIEFDKVDAALVAIGATRVVIGHTPTVTRRVLQRLDGKVIEIDTGMLTAAYKGSGNALIVEGASLNVINESGSSLGEPLPHPRRVGIQDDAVNVDELAAALTEGAIESSRVDPIGRTIVTLSKDSGGFKALFAKNPRDRGFVPEVAAYRLDRLLGLDMVPITVERELDGVAGSLQFLPPKTIDESERAAGRKGGDAWCPLPEQWGAMYVFDTLIFNSGRSPQNTTYSPDYWQLVLTGHQDAFAAKRGRPPWAQPLDLALGDAWVRALHSIDDATLRSQLGDVLDRKRLDALGKRRDELLKAATK
jgi:3',5'-cyclic AMP phosphodiesterase CpdA